MSKPNLHSADGSFLVFLFQIERVLIWLSEGGENGKVGIETDDDIVVHLKKGDEINIIYEQAKNAQTGNIPFSDKSEDLWKTLSIWIGAVESGKVDVETAVFSAITNKKLPNKRLLLKLSNAKKDDVANMDLLITELKTIAASLSSSNKAFGDVIIKCEAKILAKIVDRIVFLGGDYVHNRKTIKSTLKANLSMSDSLPFDHIYNGLFGHVTNQIIDHWRNNEEAWISVESFNKLYNQLVAEYLNKSFLEKATDLLPVTNKQVEKNQKNYM